MSSTEPHQSPTREGNRRRASKKKSRKSDNNKPHCYPTRRELEGKTHAKLQKKLQDVGEAEKRIQRRYDEQLTRAATLDTEELADAEESVVRSSDVKIPTTAASCVYQQTSSRQGSDNSTTKVSKRCACARPPDACLGI